MILTDIRKALADQIRDYVARDTNVVWYAIDSADVPYPRISIRPGDPYVSYYTSMGAGGNADINLTVRVEVMATDDENTNLKLDDYLSTTEASSIPNAIMADRTLSGTVGDCVALEANNVNTALGSADIPVFIILAKSGANV